MLLQKRASFIVALLALAFIVIISPFTLKGYTPVASGSSAAMSSTASPAHTATANDRDRTAAEKAFAEAAQLSKASKAEFSRLAISKYEEALSYWKAAGNLREQARALVSIGDIHQVFGELYKSLAFYNQALGIYKGTNDRRNEGETLNAIGHIYFILSENEKALSFCTRALNLSQSTGNRAGTARALNNLGDAYYGFGNIQRSLDHYQRALSLWRELGDQRGQANALLSLGYDYSDLGEMQKAFDCFNHALSIWESNNEQRWQAITLTAIGRLYSRLGESQDAFNYFKRAMEIIVPIGDQIEQGSILSGMAYLYYRLGDKQQALAYYYKALHLFENAGYLGAQANALSEIGNVYYSIEDYEKALDYYKRQLSISISMNDKRERAYAVRGIGMVYKAWGNDRKALDYYIKTLSFFRSEKDLRGEADTLRMIGQIHDEGGQRQRALYYYNRALSLSRTAKYPFAEASTLYNMARVARDLGNQAEARARIEAAVKIIESLRERISRQDLRSSYFASVPQHYEFYIDLLMQMHAQQPAAGFDVAALEASERARARSFTETLAAARIGVHQKVDPALLEREHVLRQELNSKAAYRMGLLNIEHTREEAARLASEIDDLTRQHREAEAQIRIASLDNSALIQSQPLNFRTIQQQAIDDDALLLEFSLGETRSYLWAATKTELRSYQLPARTEVEALANRVRDILTAPQFLDNESFEQRKARLKETELKYRQEASLLSKMLLGPVARQLENKRLIIIADGALQYIPFSALPDPESNTDDPDPLMVRHEVTYQASASALVALRNNIEKRQPASNLLIVFADPVFEKDDSRLAAGNTTVIAAAQEQSRGAELYGVGALQAEQRIPRLFASRDEAEAVMSAIRPGLGSKAIGFEANKTAATSSELKQYRIIHFATHGLLDSENPDLSGLVLSLFDKQGEPQDGFLRLNDIYNLELPADLIVLSACNTGLGKQIKGEGLIGLTRGFMYAGASRVMASLWKVDDEATAELVKYFYREMLSKKKSPAEALRQAQITMWRQNRWRSPYFWAAFVLQGEYKGEIDDGGNGQGGAPRLISLAVIFAILGLIVLYTARRTTLKKQQGGFTSLDSTQAIE